MSNRQDGIRGILLEIDSYSHRGFVSFVFVVGKVTRKMSEERLPSPVLTDPRDQIVLNERDDAGWYRPFGFADGQLRGPRRLDIDDKYGRFCLAATGLRGF